MYVCMCVCVQLLTDRNLVHEMIKIIDGSVSESTNQFQRGWTYHNQSSLDLVKIIGIPVNSGKCQREIFSKERYTNMQPTLDPCTARCIVSFSFVLINN